MPRSTITTRFAFEETNATVLQRVNRGVSQFSSFVFSPAGAIAGAAALGAAITGVTGRYLENADALQKMSLRTGLGTEELGALRFAFEQADLSADDLQRTISRLNDRGLTLDEFADQIAGIDDIGERTSRTIDVLGERLGPRLLSVLDQGSEGLDRYREQHERLGLAIDQESANAAATFNDNIDTIQRVVEGAGNRIGQAIVNWGGPILDAFGRSVGILPDETRDKVREIEAALVSRVGLASAAGETYGKALTDPIANELAASLVELEAYATKAEAIIGARFQAQYNAFVGPAAPTDQALTDAFTGDNAEARNRRARLEEAQRIRNLGEGAGNPYLATPFGPQFTVGAPGSLIGPGAGGLPAFAVADPSRTAFGAVAAQAGGTFDPFFNKEQVQIQTEAIRANRIVFEGGTDDDGRGFGGGSISGQSLIDASKNDPVRVTLAGVGGLNEGAGENQRFRELRVDGDDLINREALISVVLDILEDHNR